MQRIPASQPRSYRLHAHQGLNCGLEGSLPGHCAASIPEAGVWQQGRRLLGAGSPTWLRRHDHMTQRYYGIECIRAAQCLSKLLQQGGLPIGLSRLVWRVARFGGTNWRFTRLIDIAEWSRS